MTQTPWILLHKHNPTSKTLRLEWQTCMNHVWVYGQERRVRIDGTETPLTGGQTRAASERAAKALQKKWIAERLADGYVYKTTPKPSESKPWAKGKAKPPTWLAKVDQRERSRLRKLIEKAKLAHRADDIESLLRPAIRFDLKPAKTARGVTTRFGGDPDLPPGFEWPTHGKTPLAFVAQFRLDEIARFDLAGRLPKTGVLSLFAYLVPDDGPYAGHVSLHYFPEPKRLSRTAPTHDASADGRPRKQALATPRLALTLPSPDERGGMRGLKLSDDERERYHDKLWLEVRRDSSKLRRSQQLLGGPPDFLLQLDSDDRIGLDIGDIEAITVSLPPKQIAAIDFRAARASMADE